MRMNLTSAAGILALLEEPEGEIKNFALNKLNEIVDVFWPEISENVDKIEMLYEDESFKHRNLAALVASKVYYHLGSFEDSLTYALGADKLFDITVSSEYVETIIAKCIDYYTKLRVNNVESSDIKDIDPRLEAVVNRMFQRCFDDKKYKQAVGISIETRRVDIFEKAIMESGDVSNMLSYSLKVCMSLIQNGQFRNTVLRILVKLYMGLQTPDYINVCQCLIFLDDPQAVGEILKKLIKEGEEESTLTAYQIGFDLYESATQQFLTQIQSALRGTAPIPISDTHPAAAATTAETPKTEENKSDETKSEDTKKKKVPTATLR